MKKKILNNQRLPNFSNPKTMAVIKHLQLAENRLSRNDIYQLANKDILYQLKNNGYVKETAGNIFSATPKLQTYMKRLDNSSFGYSSSTQHSKNIANSIHLLPKQILYENRFKTGKELEVEHQTYRKTNAYQEAVKTILTNYTNQQKQTFLLHKEKQQGDYSQLEKFKDMFSYRYHIDKWNTLTTAMKEQTDRVPDYEISLTREEAKQYQSALYAYGEEHHKKEYLIASEKVETILQQSNELVITLCIEIITNNYGRIELEQHYNYELTTGKPVIIL